MGMSAVQIAKEYGLTRQQIEEVLAFYAAHRDEIDAHLQREALLAGEAHG